MLARLIVFYEKPEHNFPFCYVNPVFYFEYFASYRIEVLFKVMNYVLQFLCFPIYSYFLFHITLTSGTGTINLTPLARTSLNFSRISGKKFQQKTTT